MLAESWQQYKLNFIAQDGRPVGWDDKDDIDGDGDRTETQTYSETAGFVLLRAALANDRQAFDKVWRWTEKNLQRKNIGQVYNWNAQAWQSLDPAKKDALMAWRYLPNFKGRAGGIIDYTGPSNPWRGGLDGAADGDLDAAGALIIAHQKWGSAGSVNYQNSARDILDSIWNKYVHQLVIGPVLAGGDQMGNIDRKGIGVNPSYMRPYYFSVLFPMIDQAHPWPELARTSYAIIAGTAAATLHDEKGQPVTGSTGLPANWAVTPDGKKYLDMPWFADDYVFGWDALRTISLGVVQDAVCTGSAQARDFLIAGPHAFILGELGKNRTAAAEYPFLIKPEAVSARDLPNTPAILPNAGKPLINRVELITTRQAVSAAPHSTVVVLEGENFGSVVDGSGNSNANHIDIIQGERRTRLAADQIFFWGSNNADHAKHGAQKIEILLPADLAPGEAKIQVTSTIGLLGGYRIDGKPYSGANLDRTQWSVDAATWLPYLFYAGKRTFADQFLSQIRTDYRQGQFGDGVYYGQNLSWFGLYFVNEGCPLPNSK